MANLYQNASGIWLIRFRFDARQYYRSLGTTDEAEARGVKAVVEETLSLLKRGRLSLPEGAGSDEAALFIISGGKIAEQPKVAPAAKTLKQTTDNYFDELPEGAKSDASIYTEKIHVGHLVRILKGATPLREIGVAELQGYVNKRSREDGQKGKKVQPETIKKELATFGMIWNFARARKWVDGEANRKQIRLPKSSEKPPFRTSKEIESTIKQGGLSEQEIAELWDSLFLDEKQVIGLLAHVDTKAAYPFIYPMIGFAAFTGARRSEILRSQKADFNFDRKLVLIREKKRKRSVQESFRQVQLSPRLEKIMRAWFADHPGGRLTICAKADQPLTRNSAYHHFSRALAKSKWSKVRGFHVLRHSFASICAVRGVPEAIIDAWMGHQTEEMRCRYRHLYPAQAEAAMGNLFNTALFR